MDEKEILEIELENRRWLHRRRMAYISMFVMIFLTGAVLFYDKDIIEPAFYAFASIVGAYMGFSTWATKR